MAPSGTNVVCRDDLDFKGMTLRAVTRKAQAAKADKLYHALGTAFALDRRSYL